MPGIRPLGLCLSLMLMLASPGLAGQPLEELDRQATPPHRGFSTGFLKGGGDGADLEAFLNGNNVIPGTYRVDILVNGILRGRRDVRFVAGSRSNTAQPCITTQILDDGNIDIGQLGQTEAHACLALEQLVAQSTVEYLPHRLQLRLGIPQASLKRGLRDDIAPQLWDAGTSAGFVNYHLNLRRHGSPNQTDNTAYLSLKTGVNHGPWRLRNDSSLNRQTHRRSVITSQRFYAERDVTALRSQLTVGETHDRSELSESMRLRGFSLRTDEGMLPDSERGHGPVIRGVAQTQASVEIRQHGDLLLQVNVPPGPFTLTDVRPNGSAGTLEIIVTEADGLRRATHQNFASLPSMIRQGAYRYSLAAGQYQGYSDNKRGTPLLASASASYGLSSQTTLHGAAQATHSYGAMRLGVSRNLFIGAVSLDVTQSNSTTKHTAMGSQSYRMLVAKTFSQSATSLTLSRQSHLSPHYRSLADHVRDTNTDTQRLARERERHDIAMNQGLGNHRGSLHLTAGLQRYWHHAGQNQQLQLGYANAHGPLNYNLSLSHTRSRTRRRGDHDDMRLALAFSLPLGKAAHTRITSTTTAQRNGIHSQNIGINAPMPGENNAYFNAHAGLDNLGAAGAAVAMNARTSMANYAISHSRGGDFNTSTLGFDGSLVAHRGGLNAAPPLSETFALIHVENAPNVQIDGDSNLRTSANGFAVRPTVVPYQANWISLDTRSWGADTELEHSSIQVIPRRGSVTTAQFQAQQGFRIQLEIINDDGTPMQFGALVVDKNRATLGVTDPTGRALVLVPQEHGQLSVLSSNGDCLLDYALPADQATLAYRVVTAACRPVNE